MKVVVHVLAMKLKYHRLKPGGIRLKVVVPDVAGKLKHHRLKRGGVRHDKTDAYRTPQSVAKFEQDPAHSHRE